MSAQQILPGQRRRTLRVPLAVTLVSSPGGNAYATDISAGGMCFQLAAPLKPGDELTVRFELPGWRAVRATACVVWVDNVENRAPGLRYCEMGVRFVDLSAADRAAIEGFVETPAHFWPDSES